MTGALVAELAQQRGHQTTVLGASENENAQALTVDSLASTDAVIDFTTPEAALQNISACIRAGKDMVVGTNGWYSELDYVKKLVEERGTAFIYGSNFSVGVNLFFEIAKIAGAAMRQGYASKIIERHHEHKKDAP